MWTLRGVSICRSEYSQLSRSKSRVLQSANVGVFVQTKKEQYSGGSRGDGSTEIPLHWGAALIAGVATATGFAVFLKAQSKRHAVSAATEEVGSMLKGLPTYSIADVGKHKTKADRIWVTYKNGVYDVTGFVAQHPGGNKILLGAGRDIGPYWDMYGAHKSKDTYAILESHRIGNIVEVAERKGMSKDDPYANDPERHPALIPSSPKPFNAEPPISLLVQDYLTPNDLFYVRNHMPVPNVDIKKYKLDVSIEGARGSKTMTYDILKSKLPSKTILTTLQCAGNRRSDMLKIKPVKGLNWGLAAIGTAEWTGPTLNTVFKYCDIDIDTVNCEHIQFEGMDASIDGTIYGASIPIELARMLKDDIIFAYKMNGDDIPKDHGYPIRVIIPGVVGARQVKWLNKIVLGKEESLSHWQRNDYKGFNSSIDWHNVDFDKSQSIQFLPVQSAICEPEDGQTLEDNEEITVKGYAWSGGGRGIYRVDVSVDGGESWVSADIETNGQSPYRSWAWTLWEVDIPIPKGHKGKLDVICKACDSQYNVQPDNVAGIWNLRGGLSNAWHRIQVSIPK